MQYRQAELSDTPAMARIRAEGDADEADEAYHRDRMARYLAGEHHPRKALMPRVIYVALDDRDALAGYIAGHLTRRYDCDGELQWIYVRPEHRGAGVASELLRLLAAWFVEQSGAAARRVCVDVVPENTVARRFYRRHGAKDLDPRTPCWLVWDDIGVVLLASAGGGGGGGRR